MKDLTQGSIPKHIMMMAIPIGISMLIQTLYYLVDLYFVGRLGKEPDFPPWQDRIVFGHES